MAASRAPFVQVLWSEDTVCKIIRGCAGTLGDPGVRWVSRAGSGDGIDLDGTGVGTLRGDPGRPHACRPDWPAGSAPGRAQIWRWMHCDGLPGYPILWTCGAAWPDRNVTPMSPRLTPPRGVACTYRYVRSRNSPNEGQQAFHAALPAAGPDGPRSCASAKFHLRAEGGTVRSRSGQATARDRAHWLQRAERAPTRWSISASVCSGPGVKRRRSVPLGTVG